MFIYTAFKLHIEHNAQHVSTPTTTIIPIVVGTLNYFNDVEPKSGPQKENTEHGLEVRKIY